MKKSNKILAVVLALVMMLTAVPMMTASAEETEAPHTHEYVLQGEATKATCTEDGKATFKCECGDTVVRVVEVAPGHKATTYESVDSNTHKTTCETCKEVVVSNHNWDAGVVATEATCSATGVKKYTCADCKATMNETIAKKEHTIEMGKGVAEETGNNHLVYCSVCKATIKAEHDWKETVIKDVTVAPTCDKDGVKAFQCPVCTKVKTEVDPAGHKFDTLAKEDDKEHTYKCSGCDKEAAAEAHTYKVVDEKAATCTAKGEKVSKCEVCEHVLTEELPVADHSFGEAEKMDNKFHKQTCEVCGTTVGFEHTYGDWTVTKESTYTEEGEKERVCTVKGCDAKETGKVEKLKYPVGDVNGDGKVQAMDARLILQHVANTGRELSEAELKRADIVGNGDGVKATDARKVLQIVAGLE